MSPFSFFNCSQCMDPSHAWQPSSFDQSGGLLNQVYKIGMTQKGIWEGVFDTRYQIPGTWYQVPGTRYRLPGTGYRLPGTWHQVHGTRYLYLYQVPGTRYRELVLKFHPGDLPHKVPCVHQTPTLTFSRQMHFSQNTGTANCR